VRDLAIDGEQVMKLLNIPPGPQVGGILERLLAIVLENPQCNTAAYLQEQALKLSGEVDK
jgi:hypothetical protein